MPFVYDRPEEQNNHYCIKIAITVLDGIIDDEKLQENSDVVGSYLLEKLGNMRNKYPIVGDVRGKGLMIGVEMVTDSQTKQPLDMSFVSSIWEDCRRNGVLVGLGGYHTNVFRIKPPMCITREDADLTLDVFEKAVQKVQNEIQ